MLGTSEAEKGTTHLVRRVPPKLSSSSFILWLRVGTESSEPYIHNDGPCLGEVPHNLLLVAFYETNDILQLV